MQPAGVEFQNIQLLDRSPNRVTVRSLQLQHFAELRLYRAEERVTELTSCGNLIQCVLRLELVLAATRFVDCFAFGSRLSMLAN